MADHLPECHATYVRCICDRLRAAEQRVLDTSRRDSWYEDGYADALDAAREAVAAVAGETYALRQLAIRDALAAIDALRGAE